MSLDWLISSSLRTWRVMRYPFYYDRSQLALLQRIREAWGETCTIQIFGGCVRIHSEDVYLNFSSRGELEAALGYAVQRPTRNRAPDAAAERYVD